MKSKIYPLFLALIFFSLNSCQKYDKTKYVTKHITERESNTCFPFISGDIFRECSDHIIDDTHVPFYPHLVKEGDIVFLKTKYLKRFLKHMHPKIKKPYVLITHNGDEEIPGEYEKLLDDKKILMWFGMNATKQHPKLIPIPIGFGNAIVMPFFEQLHQNPVEKTRLLYLNFNPTHPEREKAREYFSSKSFCTIGRIAPFNEYIQEVASSKFQVSPRGNGIDCHRVWESIFAGTIPILKSTPLDPLYQDLPILIVNDWPEVTEDFLEEKYLEITSKDYDLEQLYADYWIKLIESHSNRSSSPTVMCEKPDSYPKSWKEALTWLSRSAEEYI